MTARDRYPDLESCTDWPEINQQTIEVLDALDRAEADADRLAETIRKARMVEHWRGAQLDALAAHDRAVAQR